MWYILHFGACHLEEGHCSDRRRLYRQSFQLLQNLYRCIHPLLHKRTRKGLVRILVHDILGQGGTMALVRGGMKVEGHGKLVDQPV